MKRRTPCVVATTVLAIVIVGSWPVPARADAAAETEAAVALTYGLAAYHQGDLEEAARLFEQAAAADPRSGDARYWLGLTRLRQGDGNAALAALRASRRGGRRPAVPRERLAADLERARRLIAGEAPAEVDPPAYEGEPLTRVHLPRWEGRLGVAAGSDSNPAILPDNLSATTPDGEIVRGAESDIVGSFDLRLEAHPFYGRGGWTLGLALDLHELVAFDLDGLDYERVRGVLQLAWGEDPRGVLVGPLGYTRVPMGPRRFSLLLQAGAREDSIDGDSFFSATEAALALTLREGRSTATRLDLSFTDEEFERGVPDIFPRGGEISRARLSQIIYLGPGNRYLRLGVSAGERSGSPAVDSELFGAQVDLSVPLSGRWHLYLTGALEQEDFDQLESNPLFPSFFADQPREDETLRLAAALSVALKPRLFLVLRGSHIDRDTRLGAADALLDLDYDRTVATVGLRWFFAGGGR